MAASAFTFGTPLTSSGGLFGAKTTQSSFSFGNQNTSGISSFGAAKTTSSFSFGTPSSTTTGFSLTTPATGGTTGGGLFGAKSTAAATGFPFATPSTGTATGGGLFGAKNNATTTGFGVGAPTLGGGLFGATTTSSSGFSLSTSTNLLGGSKTSAPTFGFTSTTTATSGAASTKPPENVKETVVPAELTGLVEELKKHIKSQKDVKEEITKISGEGIAKTKEILNTLKQNVAVISNTLQRNSIAVENLKGDVAQELKNSEICYRMNHAASNLHTGFNAPIQYFQRIVLSFESRINSYRQEIEELEAFLTSTSPVHDFTPQDLSNILIRLNESFVGLASELYQIHEVVKTLKDHYLHYRRVVYNDTSDPFPKRKKRFQSTDSTNSANTIGPSPFPVVQGAGFMMSAFKTEPKTLTVGSTATRPFGFGTTISKPPGLTRSFSFDGSATKTNFGSSLGGGSMFSKPALGPSSSINSTGALTLQKPPMGKRGRIL